MAGSTFKGLDPAKIVATVDLLSKRIDERFPQSGLWKVSRDLHAIAEEAHDMSLWIARPRIFLRCAVGVLVTILVVALTAIIIQLHPFDNTFDFLGFLDMLEACINMTLLIGGAIIFLVSLERRLKRTRALAAAHELRAIAHVIDAHQLTKDPDRILGHAPKTASGPVRMTAVELGRYLNYCSEMLSLVGKLAALYVQRFDDAVAIASVNEVETLTTGLSRKIWQKVMILHSGGK